MERKRKPVYVLITEEMDLPDYFTDDAVLRAMSYHSDPGTILINTVTGSFKIRQPGAYKANQYIRDYRNDYRLGINHPLMTQIFKNVSTCFDKDSTIFAESIFTYGNTPVEALNTYIEFYKNPHIEMRFLKTGWLDSDVIKTYMSMSEEATGISLLSTLIQRTFDTLENSPDQNDEEIYQGVRKKVPRIKKKSTQTIQRAGDSLKKTTV